MKHKAFLILFLLGSFFFTVKAQNFKCDFSEKSKRGIYFSNAVKSGDNWLSLRWTYEPGQLNQDKKIVFLMVLNDKMEVLKEKQIPLEHDLFMDVKGLFKSNGVTVLMYSYKIAKSDEEYIIAGKKVEESDLTVSAETKLGQFASTKWNTTTYFDFNYSVDSSKYLLFTEPIQTDNDPKIFYFRVLNNDLTTVHEKNIRLENENRFIRLTTTFLDKESNVYIQYRVSEIKLPQSIFIDEESADLPAYKNVMNVYKSDGSSKNLSLNLNGKISQSVIFQYTKNGRLMIGGTYTTVLKKGNITGIFMGTYNGKKDEVEDVITKDIPDKILQLFETDKIVPNTNDKGISPNFKVIRFSERDNGTIDLTLESNYSVAGRSSGSGGYFASGYLTWYSEGILNINIFSKDKILFTRIPKKQIEKGSKLNLSNSSFYIDNKLVFFYNDNKSNLVRDINKKPDKIEKFRKSILVAATIDEKGNLERKIVRDNSEDEYVPVANNIKKIASNSYLVESYKIGKVFDTEKSKIGVITVTK